MTDHRHHHHHAGHHGHTGHLHPPAPVLPSLLRSSAVQRLVIAAGLSALIWLAVYWAIG